MLELESAALVLSSAALPHDHLRARQVSRLAVGNNDGRDLRHSGEAEAEGVEVHVPGTVGGMTYRICPGVSRGRRARDELFPSSSPSLCE